VLTSCADVLATCPAAGTRSLCTARRAVVDQSLQPLDRSCADGTVSSRRPPLQQRHCRSCGPAGVQRTWAFAAGREQLHHLLQSIFTLSFSMALCGDRCTPLPSTPLPQTFNCRPPVRTHRCSTPGLTLCSASLSTTTPCLWVLSSSIYFHRCPRPTRSPPYQCQPIPFLRRNPSPSRRVDSTHGTFT